MKRALVGLVVASFVSLPEGRGETVRVAVARGPALTVEGADLRRQSAPEADWVPVGRSSKVEAVGPFASDGDALSSRLSFSDGAGALKIAGMPLLGAAEIVAGDGGLVAVDVVELEAYVASVVGAEMHASWPAAALEAQAIAVRTYVLKKKRLAGPDAAFHVEASVAHQAYRGAASLDPRTRAAAQATRGRVLVHDGALADAFFFASCSGSTESANAAFGRGAPYLVPVSCDGAQDAPGLSWERRVPLGRASKALLDAGAIGDSLARVEGVTRTATGRLATVRLVTRHGGTRVLPASELRRLLGWSVIPSLDTDVRTARDELVFRGSGAGHAVGLCQWCARGRAARGETAAAILGHFYPGTEVRALEESGAILAQSR